MAIHNELSGDIAVALLAERERNAAESNDLKRVVLAVHDTLRRLASESVGELSEDGRQIAKGTGANSEIDASVGG